MKEKIARYLLLFTLFTPIFLHLNFYQPYITGKYFWLVFFVLASLPFIILYLPIKKDFWKSNFLRVFISFFITICIINIFSIDLTKSWWGDWQRMGGLLYFSCWLVFFLGLILFFNQKKHWSKLFRVHQFIMLATVVWAWGQMFSWSIFTDDKAGRVFALIGNANFLAHYLLLGFFLSLVLFYYDQRWKIFHSLLALAIVPAILFTGSRSAFIALVICLLVLSFYFIKLWWSENIKKSLSLFFIVILVLFAGYPTLSERFTKYSFSDTTTETRLLAWQAGFEGWQDKPILGWGKNNFDIPFNKYINLDIYQGAGTRMWFDKAHNQYVDYLVEGGIIGFLAYLIFLALPIFYLKKIKLEKHSSQIRWLLGMGLLANAVFLFFNFDTVVSLLVYFIYLAFIYYLSHQRVNSRFNKSYLRLGVAVLILTIAAFFVFYKPLLANIRLKNIQITDTNSSLLEFVQLADEVSQLAPAYQQDLSFVLTQVVAKNNWTIEEEQLIYNLILFYIHQAALQHPLDAKLHYLTANVYLSVGDLEKAINYYQDMIPMLTVSHRPDVIYNLAQAYYELSWLDQEHQQEYLQIALNLLQDNYNRFPKVREAEEKLQILQSVIGE